MMCGAGGPLMSVIETVSPAGKNHLFLDLSLAGAGLGKKQFLQQISREF
jgi:hypothetical protein